MTPSLKAIELNNRAVEAIRNGSLIKAYQIFSFACKHVANEHVHQENVSRNYQYAWVDCSAALAQDRDGMFGFDDGAASFMFLKFLIIQPPVIKEGDPDLCPCGFLWVLWSNLGTLSAMLGRSGSISGNRLLNQALQCYKRVQSIVDPEPLSKNWATLQLSILNNEACVLRSQSMDCQSVDKLVQLGIILTQTSDVLDPRDHELFLWTTKTLIDDEYAPAA